MSWDIGFINKQDFTKHVKATIQKYGDKLTSFDLKRFNKNLVDPVKLIFDKTVYGASWEETISNEIFRQRDKSNNNDIGYFHQRIFQYVNNCHVPNNGEEDAFFKICKKLPEVIQEVVSNEASGLVPQDRVFIELKQLADNSQVNDPDLAFALAIYMLGFKIFLSRGIGETVVKMSWILSTGFRLIWN